MSNLTSKDKNGRILVNGIHRVCNIPSQCSGSSCHENCIINRIIERLYELEHKEDVMEDLKELEEARTKKITFDADCPETTPERAKQFRGVNPPRGTKRA